MQKSISPETSPLGALSMQKVDLLDQAFDVFNSSTTTEVSLTPKFTPQQIESLFWALVDVAGMKSPSFSAKKIGELYLNASDMDGVAAFLNQLADRCPQHLSVILSRWFIDKVFRLDSDRAQQVFENVLLKKTLTLSTMALGAHNYELVKAATKGADSSAVSLGVQLLPQHLESLNHLRKVRNVHIAVEDLCHNHQIFAAYDLRDWACQLGLTLLPQTSETLLGSRVFVDSAPRIPPDLLTSGRLTLRGSIPMNQLIPKLKNALEIAASASADTAADSVDAAIDAIAKALLEHPFATDPSLAAQSLRPGVFKKTLFSFWSAVNQLIEASGGTLSMDTNLAHLAKKLIEEGHEGIVLTWISCLLRKDKIAALCYGGLLSPKSNAKFVDLLRHHPDLQYAVATSQVLPSLTPEQKDTVVKSFAVFHRAHLPTLALALDNQKFERAHSIIDELQGDAISVLAGFANSRLAYLPLISEVMKEKQLKDKIGLVNEILDGAKTYKAPTRLIFCLLDMVAEPHLRGGEEGTHFQCLKDGLSISNQVFLRTLLKSRNINHFVVSGMATGMEYLESIFPGAANASLRSSVSNAIRMGKNQELFDALLSIQKSHPSKLQAAVESVTFSLFLTSGFRNAIAILFTAAQQRNDELLEICANAALPFLHNSLGLAFKGLVDIYRQKDVDPVMYEAISFHRLSELTTPVAQPRDTPKFESLALKFDKSASADTSDPISLARESVNYLADTLASNKLSTENVRILVDVVRKLWGPGRIDLLLCHLVELRASESVNQVIESMPVELRERRLPFKTLSRLVQINAAGDVFDVDQFKEAASVLRGSPPQSLTLCMNGPHVTTLFAMWPQSHIDEALETIDNTLGRSQSLLRLQLAAALVHRGLINEIKPIVDVAGPLPFNYLAGSLQHPLSKLAFHNAFQYLKQSDLEHLPAFIDASLRNAAMSARSTTSTETAVELVKAAIEATSTDLRSYCQPSTLRLLREATKQSEEIQQVLFESPSTGSKK